MQGKLVPNADAHGQFVSQLLVGMATVDFKGLWNAFNNVSFAEDDDGSRRAMQVTMLREVRVCSFL